VGSEVPIDKDRNGKFEGVLKGHNKEISKLLFLPQYSSVISVSMDGSINMWGVDKILPSTYKNKCYMKLLVTKE
jgi:WD40 repeat protein